MLFTARTMARKVDYASASTRLAITARHLAAQRPAATKSATPPAGPGAAWHAVAVGAKYTENYRNYAVQNNTIGSFFHDVPLDLDLDAKCASMVVEIPRWSNAKMEINTKVAGNPIMQDVKNGHVRFVSNLFPYHGYIHNYGAFPQTWEDPLQELDVQGLKGDGDPLDVCEIGLQVMPTGTVRRVKILGSLALIDDGELDWKVICVATHDPLALELFDIHDVFVKCPGLLESTRQWFRDYKIPDGKPPNKFAYNGAYRGQQETLQTILDCHGAWNRLVLGGSPAKGYCIENATLTLTPGYTGTFEFNDAVLGGVAEPDAPIPDSVSKCHYVSE